MIDEEQKRENRIDLICLIQGYLGIALIFGVKFICPGCLR